MFPNIIFQEYEISKKERNISIDQKFPLAGNPIKPYVIQIGAFGNIQNAKRLKLQVAQIGYDVNIVPIKTNGRTFNAVRVVSYKSKSQAEKVGKVIKTKLGVEYRVLYRPEK
jgi:cell division protein FtsN